MGYEEFKVWIRPLCDKIENIFKAGTYTRVTGEDGELQQINIRTLRNIENAVKMGQFGFNSKAPVDSRMIVAKIGNDKVVISNEHIASILDVATGESIVYNETGTYIKTNLTDVEISAATVKIDGDLLVNGNIGATSFTGFNGGALTTNVNITTTADVQAGGVSLATHTHPYTWTDPAGSSITGVPI